VEKSELTGATHMHLKTVRGVVDALGGKDAVCDLLDATPKQVWNWINRKGGKFPACYYVKMQAALKRRGVTAPPSLWTMRGLEKKRAA